MSTKEEELMNKERISITLDGEVMEKVKQIADMEDRSFSQCVNVILKKYVKAFEKKMNKE